MVSQLFKIASSISTGLDKKYISKKIYDEVIEDIFGMSSLEIFKEIEKKKNGGCLYFVMSSVS